VLFQNCNFLLKLLCLPLKELALAAAGGGMGSPSSWICSVTYLATSGRLLKPVARAGAYRSLMGVPGAPSASLSLG